MRTVTKLPAVALAVGLGLVAFSGCAGGGAGSPGANPNQSVSEACAEAAQSVSAVQADLTDITTEVSAGNFSVVAEQLGTLHANLEDTAAALGNVEVKETLGVLADKVGDFAAIFVDAPDGDLTAIAEKVADLQAVSREVAIAGQAMTDLCN